jgi:hypothetical protein
LPRAAAGSGQYSVRRAAFPADWERVLALWRGNLGAPASMEDKRAWFYERSPTGQPLTMLLHYADSAGNERAVGVATAGRRPLRCGEQAMSGGLLVDIAVSPQHRTLFPALLLQKTLRETGLVEHDCLYGFPNPKATPVFQRVGYQKLGMMTRYVRVVRATPYLRERMPDWAAALLGSLWDSLARLRFMAAGGPSLRLEWRSASETRPAGDLAFVAGRPLVRGARSAELLRWRFAERAGHRFECVAAHSAGGALIGYWIVEATGGALEVWDCSPALLDSARASRAWYALFMEARRRGYRSVSFACLAPAELVRALERAGMAVRGERPVFCALRTEHPAAAVAWYLTAADEDE